MPSLATEVTIANGALQILGEAGISSLDENTPAAVEIRKCYVHLRDLLQRSHTWNFCIREYSLAADATFTPAEGFAFAYRYPVPDGYLRRVPTTTKNDWHIRGGYIYTSDSAPLLFDCVIRVTNPAEFDPCFAEALSAKIAERCCETITGSSTKLADARAAYKTAISDAKRTDAIEDATGEEPVESTWIQAMRGY